MSENQATASPNETLPFLELNKRYLVTKSVRFSRENALIRYCLAHGYNGWIFAHFNVCAWSEDMREFNAIEFRTGKKTCSITFDLIKAMSFKQSKSKYHILLDDCLWSIPYRSIYTRPLRRKKSPWNQFASICCKSCSTTRILIVLLFFLSIFFFSHYEMDVRPAWYPTVSFSIDVFCSYSFVFCVCFFFCIFYFNSFLSQIWNLWMIWLQKERRGKKLWEITIANRVTLQILVTIFSESLCLMREFFK